MAIHFFNMQHIRIIRLIEQGMSAVLLCCAALSVNADLMMRALPPPAAAHPAVAAPLFQMKLAPPKGASLPSLLTVPPLVYQGVELPNVIAAPMLSYTGIAIPNTFATPKLSYTGIAVPDHFNTPGLRYSGQRAPVLVPRL